MKMSYLKVLEEKFKGLVESKDYLISHTAKKKKKKSDLIKSSQHLGGMGMIFENSKFTKMLVLSFIEFAKLAKDLILDAVVS